MSIREIVLILLCLAGLADTVVLHVEQERGTLGQFCEALSGHAGAGCEKVLTSKYSEVAGIKLALIGALYYLSMLWLSIWTAMERVRGGGSGARIFLVAVSGVGLIFSGFLTYVQAKVIEAWCPFCLASAALTLLIFILSICNAFAARRVEQPSTEAMTIPAEAVSVEVEPSMWIGALVLVCVVLASGLILTVMYKGSDSHSSSSPSVLEEWMKYVPRRVAAPGGLAYGSDTAPIVIQAFLDYTCSHCRDFEKTVFPQIKANYIDRGTVKWITKPLPHSDEGAPIFFAVAGMCGRFRPDSGLIEQAFFSYPMPSPKAGFDALVDALSLLGLDTSAGSFITDCMLKRGDAMRDSVVVEIQQAFSYGIKGPPGFVIDGIAFQGTMDYRTMSGIIDVFLRNREN